MIVVNYKIKEGEKRPKYILGKIAAEFEDFIGAGEQLKVVAFANKMLDTGGYSEIKLSKSGRNMANIKIIYSVIRQGLDGEE